MLQQVELFILIHHPLVRPNTLSGFTFQRKDRLCSTLRTLVMEPEAESPSVMKSMVSLPGVFVFTEVKAAVTQFPVVQVGFLGPFIRQFLDAGYLFPLPLALHDALLQRFSSLRILCAGSYPVLVAQNH